MNLSSFHASLITCALLPACASTQSTAEQPGKTAVASAEATDSAGSPSQDDTAAEEETAAEEAAAVQEEAAAETQRSNAAGAGSSAAAAPAGDAGGETRTTEAIAAVVKENRQQVRDCYEAQLDDEPGLEGELVIFFVLDPAGQVKEASFNEERSTIQSQPLAECAIAAIETWQFPESSRGMETKVNYPFDLNP